MEKKMDMETIYANQRKVEHDKRDFDNAMTMQKRGLENKELILREEEQRITRLREELQQERLAFDHQRASVSYEMEAAEKITQQIREQQDELKKEKEQIAMIVHRIRAEEAALETLHIEYQQQMEALQEREAALRQGFAEMKLATQTLEEKERNIAYQHEAFETKAQELGKMEQAMEDRRLSQARAFREYIQKMPNQIGTSPDGNSKMLLLTGVHDQNQGDDERYLVNAPPPPPGQASFHSNSVAPAVSAAAGGYTYRASTLSLDKLGASGLPKEVKLAQRALREHRHALIQLSSTSLASRQLLSKGKAAGTGYDFASNGYSISSGSSSQRSHSAGSFVH
jgi:hypothetical protein